MTEEDLLLIEELGAFSKDPYAFALWAFPWGEPGTELEKFSGPNEFQTRILCMVRDGLLSVEAAILIAVTSGHGVGKSALVAILVWWAFSTREKTRGVVTANTENQLKTKTWVEIAKWHRLFIASHLFKCTATAVFSTDEMLEREWRIDIVPWSERNTEAFAGLHNQGNRIIVIFDEASAIPDVIWEVTEGALTDLNTEIIWLVCGNPTKNTGRFRECFPGGKFNHRWQTFKVDSRTVPLTNKEQLQRWIDDYGIDSDFVKVRILGEFPSVDSSSFISRDLIASAVGRVIEPQAGPIILGVDVARYGTNLSVAWPRRGRDAASILPRAWSGLSLVALGTRVASFAHEIGASALFVDGVGVGGGLVDILTDLGLPVYEILANARPDGTTSIKAANKRAEMWIEFREALPGLSLPKTIPGYERDIVEEVSAPEYTINGSGAIQLEAKEMMRRRGVESPDAADALCLTYAMPGFVADFDPLAFAIPERKYDPYAPERLR
ncbi:MAG TPA: terminase [Rhizobium sp.]|nr:terminase [Rhizobium sp.]